MPIQFVKLKGKLDGLISDIMLLWLLYRRLYEVAFMEFSAKRDGVEPRWEPVITEMTYYAINLV